MKNKFSIAFSMTVIIILSLFVTGSALANPQTQLVSINKDGTAVGNGNSFNPRFSADGRFVAFESGSGDLVANDTNSLDDVFIRDMQTGSTTLISANQSGNSSNSESYWPV